ncbi:hypothetical protein CKO45_25100 [Paracraurococcus ruber]|uniref:Acyltransferase 3 domain-containing protein n=1 Tax=Paracraurococcus ruber TaxID=77675 RepID=A0ABS1D4F6_9PROT|nr:hypothetical protein [Paracraurococcus ruber]
MTRIRFTCAGSRSRRRSRARAGRARSARRRRREDRRAGGGWRSAWRHCLSRGRGGGGATPPPTRIPPRRGGALRPPLQARDARGRETAPAADILPCRLRRPVSRRAGGACRPAAPDGGRAARACHGLPCLVTRPAKRRRPPPAEFRGDRAIRIHALDSLRGIAALSVVLYHCLLVWPSLHATLADHGVPFFHTAQDPLAVALLTIPPPSLLWAGREAVLLFFVLSGFVLAQSFLRGPQPWLPFILRRACRLLLPCLAVTLPVALLVALADPSPQPGWSVWVTGHWAEAPTLGQLTSHALLLAQPYDLNSPLWSLHYEWRISLAFPLLVLLGATGPGRAMLASLAGMALAAAEMRLLGSDWLSSLFFLPHFMLGVLLAQAGAG